MRFYENGFESVAALCVGSASIAFGVMPSGAMEAGIGLAGLTGFILGRKQQFGPECSRVRKKIQKNVLSNYQQFIRSDGENWDLEASLFAANDALNQCLEKCIIDKSSLAKSAVTAKGFPEEAIIVIMDALAAMRPDIFASDKKRSLSYRFAYDVIKAGIEAAIENIDYYRQLEPKLMFEMARTLGEITEDIDTIKVGIEAIKSDIDSYANLTHERLLKLDEHLIEFLKINAGGKISLDDAISIKDIRDIALLFGVDPKAPKIEIVSSLFKVAEAHYEDAKRDAAEKYYFETYQRVRELKGYARRALELKNRDAILYAYREANVLRDRCDEIGNGDYWLAINDTVKELEAVLHN